MYTQDGAKVWYDYAQWCLHYNLDHVMILWACQYLCMHNICITNVLHELSFYYVGTNIISADTYCMNQF